MHPRRPAPSRSRGQSAPSVHQESQDSQPFSTDSHSTSSITSIPTSRVRALPWASSEFPSLSPTSTLPECQPSLPRTRPHTKRKWKKDGCVLQQFFALSWARVTVQLKAVSGLCRATGFWSGAFAGLAHRLSTQVPLPLFFIFA